MRCYGVKRADFWESEDPGSNEDYAIVCIVLGKLFTVGDTEKLENLSFLICKMGLITLSTSSGTCKINIMQVKC